MNDKCINTLSSVLCENIRTFDSGDLFSEFVEQDEIKDFLKKYSGNVDTNPKISKFENDTINLIKKWQESIVEFTKNNLKRWSLK